MLSRTAANLYWLGRYVERMENTVRIIEAADRMAKMPNWRQGADPQRNEWHSAAITVGCDEALIEKHGEATLESIVDFILLSPSNPSSVHACLFAARTNARAVRTALTSEMWESLNDTWIEFQEKWARQLVADDISVFLDWVRERMTLFRGALMGNMMRDEAFAFVSAGVFIERADNTARILDVKYYVLLPANEQVGGSVDYYQWGTILRSVSALGAYNWVYRDTIKPMRVAELLILNKEMPRSLVFAIGELIGFLELLAEKHGKPCNCVRLAKKLSSEVKYSEIEDVFQKGLHEFLEDFLVRNAALGDAIADDFLFDP